VWGQEEKGSEDRGPETLTQVEKDETSPTKEKSLNENEPASSNKETSRCHLFLDSERG